MGCWRDLLAAALQQVYAVAELYATGAGKERSEGMSNAVMITLIICVTLIALSLINKKKK